MRVRRGSKFARSGNSGRTATHTNEVFVREVEGPAQQVMGT